MNKEEKRLLEAYRELIKQNKGIMLTTSEDYHALEQELDIANKKLDKINNECINQNVSSDIKIRELKSIKIDYNSKELILESEKRTQKFIKRIFKILSIIGGE